MNYNKHNWQNVRNAVLRRDKYECQECKRYDRRDKNGLPVKASHVHHILPAEECNGKYEQLKLDSRNLISLCQKCHNKMHIYDGSLSKEGNALLTRKRILSLDL